MQNGIKKTERNNTTNTNISMPSLSGVGTDIDFNSSISGFFQKLMSVIFANDISELPPVAVPLPFAPRMVRYITAKPAVRERDVTSRLNLICLRIHPRNMVPQKAASRTIPIGPLIPVTSMM